MDKRNISY